MNPARATRPTRRPIPSAAWLLAAVLSMVGCGEKPLPAPPTTAPATTNARPAATEPVEHANAEPSDKPAAEPSEKTADMPKEDGEKWTNLFDGQALGNWRSTQFGGEAEVTVEEGSILLPIGEDMTGITWRGEPPFRMNYEIEVEAKRVEGSDFFCALTFPVGKDYCSLICGGWGGGLTGLSSLDDNDASRNETSKWINYEKNKWYTIRVRVTENRIEAWLDGEQVVDADTTGRKIGIRGEVDPSKPLGIATWRTTGAIRAIRVRPL